MCLYLYVNWRRWHRRRAMELYMQRMVCKAVRGHLYGQRGERSEGSSTQLLRLLQLLLLELVQLVQLGLWLHVLAGRAVAQEQLVPVAGYGEQHFWIHSATYKRDVYIMHNSQI